MSIFLQYFSITPDNTTFVQPSYGIKDFINKKVDIITAFRSNELFELNQKHIPYNVIDPIEYGFTTNAINLFVLNKTAKKSPQMVADILSATKKGWEYALNHIDYVAQLIHEKYQPNKSLALLQYEGRVTKELMLPKLYDIGEINKGFIEKNLHHLIKAGKIDSDADVSQIIYQPKKTTKASTNLTPSEKAWLKIHPVVTYSEINWKPLSIIQNNRMEGIMGDYMKLIAQKSGLHFKYKKAKSWGEVLKMFKEGKIDVVPGAGSSPQEMALGNMSDVYAKYPMVVVTNQNYRYIASLEDLYDKIIAVPKYYTSYNFLKKNYPNIKIKETKDIKEALLLVASSQADAFVGHVAPALYYMETLQLNNLKISGNTDFDFLHHYLVHTQDKELLSIINKAIRKIQPSEIEALNAKWTHIKVENGINKKLLYKVAVALFLIGLFVLYRHLELRKHNKELKVLQKRMNLALLASKSGVWDWDIIHDKLYLSPEWKKVLDYEDDELENNLQAWSSHVHPEDIDWVMQSIEESSKNKVREKYLIYRMKKKDGSYIWIHSKSITDYDEDGNAVRTIGTHIDITTMKEAEEKLDHLAKHDALTGLPNRVFFHDRLNKALQRARRNGTKIALFFVDLDHFKEINDSLGHDVGDKLLKKVALRLQGTLREVDTLARLGGDEFSIIIEDLKSEEDSVILAEKMITTLQEPIALNGNLLYISSSIGISFYPRDGERSEDLLKYSDAAMYKAKHEGRNNYQFYSKEMTELAYERVFMEKELRQALQKEEFVVYYQPQVDAQDNRIVGMEALVRWQHPKMGLLFPDQFLQIAEDTGLIVKLDRIVMRQALQQLKQWQEKEHFQGTLSLNLSMKHLFAKDFIEKFEEILQKSGIEAQYVELEVLEHQIMKNPQEAIKTLTKIRDLGVKLSVDDFGTGYSSLAYLKRLPITKLKIDRSFVMDLPDDEEDAAITNAIIALATSLHLDIIAEGVENTAQKNYMLEHGCRTIQGYYYSKPIEASKMQLLLQR